MAATLLEIDTLMNDPTLAARCGAACIKTAYNVSNEDPATVNHVGRLAWAKSALNDPVSAQAHAAHFVIAGFVAANPTADLTAIQNITDSVLQSFVDASLAIFAS